jgi:Domain of unknown function (DUF5615)
MQWVLYGNLTPAVAEALKRHGHTVHTTAELGLPEKASIRDVVWTANKKQWDLVTGNVDLVRWIFEDRFPFKRSLVHLQLEGADVEQDDAIDRLFARYKRLHPGRLYTITGSRVKIRQLPTGSRAGRLEGGPDTDDLDLDTDDFAPDEG